MKPSYNTLSNYQAMSAAMDKDSRITDAALKKTNRCITAENSFIDVLQYVITVISPFCNVDSVSLF
jgi:hypothetical protein